jgi:hypothetical protein
MHGCPARSRRLPFAFAVLVLASFPLGCSDSEDSLFTAITGSGGDEPASLENVWPNEDGRAWAYRLDQRVWDQVPRQVYATPEEVPPIPSVDEVVALLGNHPIGDNPVSDVSGYRMRFHGMKTTQSGAVGQNLETEMFALTATAARSRFSETAPDAVFWRSLARARPDLVPRIAALLPETARLAAKVAAAEVDPPLYLFGNAWEKTEEYIGSYGDLNTLLAWEYLEADLTPGHEFTIQLIPDVVDDVFLHVRVLAERTATTALGTHPHSIDVLYVVDYGLAEAFDDQFNVIGYSRSYDYGTITYAPGVGPVATYERSVIGVGEPVHPGYREMRGAVTAVAPGQGTP